MATWDDFLSGLGSDFGIDWTLDTPTDLGSMDWSLFGNEPAADWSIPTTGWMPDVSTLDLSGINSFIGSPEDVLPANLLDLYNQGTAGGDNALFGASPGAPGTTGMTNLDRMIAAGINPGTGEPLSSGSFLSNLLGGASKLGSGLLNLAKGLGAGAAGAGGGLGGGGGGIAPAYGMIGGQPTAADVPNMLGGLRTSADVPSVGGYSTNTGPIPSLSLADLRAVPLGGVSVPGVPAELPMQGGFAVPQVDLPPLAQQAAQPILPMPAVPQRIAPMPFNPMPIAVSGAAPGSSGADALAALLAGRGGGASGLQRLISESLG